MNRRKILLAVLTLLFLNLVLLLLSNRLVSKKAEKLTFENPVNIPENKVGLVLGTVKILENGRLNLYFQLRIDAAEKLFKSGKVKYLIVSGDNKAKGYDEPTDMKNSLIERGVPEARIFADYAGFRTLDSVVRAKEIFNQDSITIISQKFHNERAIFIAKNRGIKAVGFNAGDVSRVSGFRTVVREYFARVKVIIDLYLTNKQPKFLGDKVEIK